MLSKCKRVTILSIALLTCGLLPATAEDAKKAIGFQIYQGNESLPPQYQHIQIIRGEVQNGVMNVNFSRRDGEKKVEKQIVLKDKDYSDCLNAMKNTKFIELPPPAPGASSGGSSCGFDLTLLFPNKKSEYGEPANPGDWTKVRSRVEALAK